MRKGKIIVVLGCVLSVGVVLTFCNRETEELNDDDNDLFPEWIYEESLEQLELPSPEIAPL